MRCGSGTNRVKDRKVIRFEYDTSVILEDGWKRERWKQAEVF